MRYTLLAVFLAFSTNAFSQIGGDRIYSFLQIPAPAVHASLGGRLLASSEMDASLYYQNPALLDSNVKREVALSYVNYFADIQFGVATLPLGDFKNGGLALNLQYANYGNFELRDPSGLKQGDFNAADYALSIGYGQRIYKRLKAGINLKVIASYLEYYNSHGISSDLLVMYQDTIKGWTAVLSANDVGFQLDNYFSDNREELPLNIQLAVSKRLKHLPLRWGLVAHHLNVWNLRYDNPDDVLFPQNQQLIGGEELVQKASWPDNLLRHLGANAELFLGKALRLRLSYDHQRRREMQFPLRNGRAGFAWGFGLNVKRFSFSYANSSLNLAGASNHFTLNYRITKS